MKWIKKFEEFENNQVQVSDIITESVISEGVIHIENWGKY